MSIYKKHGVKNRTLGNASAMIPREALVQLLLEYV